MKTIGQKAARDAIRRADTLKVLLDQEIQKREAAERDARSARESRDNAYARLAVAQKAIVLTDERDIVEWHNVPQDVMSAVDVATRIGCVVVLERAFAQDWATTPPTETHYLKVKSARKVSV